MFYHAAELGSGGIISQETINREWLVNRCPIAHFCIGSTITSHTEVVIQDFDLGHGTKNLHISAIFSVYMFSYKLSGVAGGRLTGMAFNVKC